MNPILVYLKKLPFLRLLAGLICGIIIQWNFKLPHQYLLVAIIVATVLLISFSALPLVIKFRLRWAPGILIILMCMGVGTLITHSRNITHAPGWYPESKLLLTLSEPPVEKNNSYKILAIADAIYTGGKWKPCKGRIILYFKTDGVPPGIQYGAQIITGKQVQGIRNSGNPGAFDYKRYCLFHGITGQVFLQKSDYKIVPGNNTNRLQDLLYRIREVTLYTLRKYIPGEKERGVAEALLIGYREDLDKDLVQAYSNTGVVHIIAISGLHLGMIYGLLIWLFGFFRHTAVISRLKPLSILLVLWTFTLVAGAAPSILRSAVMFTFIVAGEILDKRSTIINSLAASAFCMLVFNPFLLWDAGFLLSYAAVLGIVLFTRHVYSWVYYNNKLLDKLWQLTSVTIGAQVFTIPLVVFYFHQFPNFFLITNFIAVPLSGLILYGEIILLCIAVVDPAGKFTGAVLHYLLKALNGYIENINSLPIAIWSNIQLTMIEAWFLAGAIAAAAIWLLYRLPKAFITAAFFATIFSVLLCVDYTRRNRQQKLVVYNVPKYAAMDILPGSSFYFTGDGVLQEKGTLQNFYLTPSRIFYRATNRLQGQTLTENKIYITGRKHILLLARGMPVQRGAPKIPVDILIITHNPRLYINQLVQVFDTKMIVFDSSNPLWKIQLWKKDCEKLHLRFHSVTESGAYVTDL